MKCDDIRLFDVGTWSLFVDVFVEFDVIQVSSTMQRSQPVKWLPQSEN